MRLPVNVRKPRITSTTSALVRNVVNCAAPSRSHRWNSAAPTSPAASPPNAWDSAVRCGTAVSGTRDSGTPTRNPAAIAASTQPWCTISGCTQVASTAMAMPSTPAYTPRRADFGSFIQYSAKMNNAVAAMAASCAIASVIAS